MKPYLKRIKSRIAKNTGKPLWPMLEQRWTGLLDECRKYLAAAERGVPFQRDQRRASHELVKLAEDVAALEVIATVLAMFMMREEDPHRFRSDRGFRFQLARRVRGLSDVNAGEYYDHITGKQKRVYREMPPRATEMLAEWLAKALGGAGLHLAGLERKERDVQEQAKQDLHAALREIE